jgi:hypothetical protein
VLFDLFALVHLVVSDSSREEIQRVEEPGQQAREDHGQSIMCETAARTNRLRIQGVVVDRLPLL